MISFCTRNNYKFYSCNNVIILSKCMLETPGVKTMCLFVCLSVHVLQTYIDLKNWNNLWPIFTSIEEFFNPHFYNWQFGKSLVWFWFIDTNMTLKHTLTTVLNLKKALSKFCEPSILRTLSTTSKNSAMAWVYFSWISLTRASRLMLPAPPISAAPCNNRKCRVVSTSSSTSLHLKSEKIIIILNLFFHF